MLETIYDIAPNAKKTAAATFLETVQEVGAAPIGVLTLELGNAMTDEMEKTTSQQIVHLNRDHSLQNQDDSMETFIERDLQVQAGYEKLVLPFGQQKQATLYVPTDLQKEDASYLYDVIALVLKQVYSINTKS